MMEQDAITRFDALPPPVRAWARDCPIDVPTGMLVNYVERFGADGALRALAAMLPRVLDQDAAMRERAYAARAVSK